MYSVEELAQREKELKKALRELGGLTEFYPDIKKNYDEQISTVKKIIRADKTAEENKSAIFGKGAKQKKDAQKEIEEKSARLEELENEQKELDKKIEPKPTIADERKNELAALVDNFKEDEIKALPFDELAFCFLVGLTKLGELNSAEQKNDILTEKYKRLQNSLHPAFVEKLKAAEEYFIAFSPATSAPYLNFNEKNGQSSIWLFTKEDYAINCKQYFARQYIFTDVVRFSKDEFLEFAKNLPRWGFNSFTLNNGVHNITVALTELTGKVQYSCPINPMLHIRRLDFFQALLSYNKVPQTNHKLYEQYHNPLLMKAKESVMLHELYKAKYTIVMKVVKTKNEKGEEVESSEIPTNMKDDKRFLLIFTDMLEFNSWKSAAEFKTEGQGYVAKAVDFATIDKMATETDSELLIDRNGWCFEFTKDRREAAKQVAEQVEKLQAEQKKNEKK